MLKTRLGKKSFWKKNYNLKTNGFTLVEMVVSITILSIMMISIISIFIFSSDLSLRIDINRSMQNNVKNLVETIAEDIRKNGTLGVSKDIPDSCSKPDHTNKYKIGTKLCSNSNNEYFLAQNISGIWKRVNDKNVCKEISSNCVAVIKKSGKITPLTNSLVSFRSLDFSISGKFMDKVTINFVVQPSTSKGVKSNLIKESKLVFQTTISKRLIETK